MKRFVTHVCLVSAQAAPNLEPAMNEEIKPDRVVLAVSPDMEQQASWLESVLNMHAVKVQRLRIPDPYDYHACFECFFDWLDGCEEEVALNATGGTKLMAMAAVEAFRTSRKPVFYIKADTDEVVRLDLKEEPFTLTAKIGIRDFLAVHGYSIIGKLSRPQIDRHRRDLCSRLASDSERLGSALGRMNWLAMKAAGSLESPLLDRADQNSKGLNELISMFSVDGLLTHLNGKLKFPNEDARAFVNGGWLESLIYQSLSTLAPKLNISDFGVDLNVLAPDGKTKNQLDAACLLKNTLHIIECKTANLVSDNQGGDTAATDALYKIDGLRRMGGLRTRALLVDYRGGLRDVDKARAAQMRIAVISGSQLRDIGGALKAWLK